MSKLSMDMSDILMAGWVLRYFTEENAHIYCLRFSLSSLMLQVETPGFPAYSLRSTRQLCGMEMTGEPLMACLGCHTADKQTYAACTLHSVSVLQQEAWIPNVSKAGGREGCRHHLRWETASPGYNNDAVALMINQGHFYYRRNEGREGGT